MSAKVLSSQENLTGDCYHAFVENSNLYTDMAYPWPLFSAVKTLSAKFK